MFSLSDLRETKVYQEALEEGIEQGIERGIERGIEQGIERGRRQEKLDSIPRLFALGLSVEKIAQALALDVTQVQQVIEKQTE